MPGTHTPPADALPAPLVSEPELPLLASVSEVEPSAGVPPQAAAIRSTET
jgi:hypothetical protein